jgi:hypothetical protein
VTHGGQTPPVSHSKQGLAVVVLLLLIVEIDDMFQAFVNTAAQHVKQPRNVKVIHDLIKITKTVLSLFFNSSGTHTTTNREQSNQSVGVILVVHGTHMAHKPVVVNVKG